MTQEEKQLRTDTLKTMEKSAWKSKKFKFGVFTELFLVGLAVLTILTFKDSGASWPLFSFLTVDLFMIGMVAFTFCGYQASCDKVQRMAAFGVIPQPQRGLMDFLGGQGKPDEEDDE